MFTYLLPHKWYVVYNVRFNRLHRSGTVPCYNYVLQSAQFVPVYYPTNGMLCTMSDLTECIRDCSMLYVLQSAQLLPVYFPTVWYVVYNVRLNGMHQGLFHAVCTTKCSIFACLLYTPQCGMLCTMSDLMECIRDCSMLYVLQSAQFLPVYYPTVWYAVYNVRFNGMHQGLFHAVCTTKCSIVACLLSHSMVCCIQCQI